MSRSCDVANRRCSNSTIQWLWVSNSVSGRGREGVSILVFHEPKFAVIEISWPGNRRHSVEQSLRYRRLVYRIISSIISRYIKRVSRFLNNRENWNILCQLFHLNDMDPWFFLSLIREEKDFDLWKIIRTLPAVASDLFLENRRRGLGQRIEINKFERRGETSAVLYHPFDDSDS